jgi:long-chain acyl-CoA synthetase
MTVSEHNLAHLAEQAFERRGDYEALLFEGRWHTSGELHERSLRLAGGLAELGIAPGDRVVVTMANCPEVGISYNALWRAGAVVTPGNFLMPPEELRHVIANSEASAVITTPEFADKVREASDGVESLRFVISSGSVDGFVPLSDLEQADPAPIAPRRDDELAALLYTGGTTGRAKGVMLTHANLHFTGQSANAAAHVPGINRGLGSLPLSHAYGLLVTIAGMHSPEQVVAVLLRWFDPQAFLELVAEHRIQMTAVVPSMLQILLS